MNLIEPVGYIPPDEGKGGLYREILREFVDSEVRYARIKDVRNLRLPSFVMIAKYDFPEVKIHSRSHGVYLERLDQ